MDVFQSFGIDYIAGSVGIPWSLQGAPRRSTRKLRHLCTTCDLEQKKDGRGFAR